MYKTVTVISGDYVLILDPTGKSLPPRRGQRRTAYKKKISFILEYVITPKYKAISLTQCEDTIQINSGDAIVSLVFNSQAPMLQMRIMTACVLLLIYTADMILNVTTGRCADHLSMSFESWN